MARALQDIITELNSVYDPQRKSYQSQIAALDPQLQAQQQGLEAQKRDSFQQITDAANRRGMFYSGLPIAEEQRYTGQQFLPAVANLRAKYATQKFGLEGALQQLGLEQRKHGENIYQQELNREEQQRQFDARMTAEAASRASSGGGGGGYGFDLNGMFGGGNVGTQQQPNYAQALSQKDPRAIYNVLKDANDAFFGGKASWQQLADWAEQQLGAKIGSGTAQDRAFRYMFAKVPFEYSGQKVTKTTPFTARNALNVAQFALGPFGTVPVELARNIIGL